MCVITRQCDEAVSIASFRLENPAPDIVAASKSSPNCVDNQSGLGHLADARHGAPVPAPNLTRAHRQLPRRRRCSRSTGQTDGVTRKRKPSDQKQRLYRARLTSARRPPTSRFASGDIQTGPKDKRYPTPVSVSRYCGCAESLSSLCRRWPM